MAATSLSASFLPSIRFDATAEPRLRQASSFVQTRAPASCANVVVVVGARSAAKLKSASATPKSSSSRGAGLKKPVDISPALQKFLGTQQASRADTMKLIWDHIKRHNLQSESDRRHIVCDEKLKDLLGKDEVNFLEIAGLLNQHFLKSI